MLTENLIVHDLNNVYPEGYLVISHNIIIIIIIMNAGINECETGAADCAPDATCFDTPGSFECRCNEGFEGDGRTGCTPRPALGEFH